VNDAFTVESGEVRTLTNNNGGINGGITNGMPIIFRTAVKPTPSIKTEQNTISLSKMENTKITVGGRHDPSIAPRVRAVIDSVTAIVLADMLTTRFGTDYLKNDKL
jgi:chorismate synthase